MKSRFGQLGVALAMLVTLVAVVPVAAAPVVDTSTEGYPMFTVPGTDSGRGTVINNNNWIAVDGAFWNYYDPAISPLPRAGSDALLWKGAGSPVPIAGEFMVTQQLAHNRFVIRDLNNSGEIVGDYHRSGAVYPTGFYWSESTGFTHIPVPGSLDKQVTGIDDSGQVTGWNYASGTSGLCGNNLCSFVGTRSSVSTILDASFQAFDIDHGLVVGTKTWTTSGNTVALPPSAGGDLGFGREVNGSGEIAGLLGLGSGVTHAAYWPSPASTPVDLGTLGADTHSAAWGINDKGWVVGWSGSSDPDADRRAFVWKPGGAMQPLGTFPGGSDSEAYDINDNDLVVGEADGRAVIWNVGTSSFSINYPPEVAPDSISNLQVVAGQTLTVQPVAADFEDDPYTIAWTGPPGAVWDDTTETLTWPTTLADEGNHFSTMTITQDGSTVNVTDQMVLIRVVAPPPYSIDPIADMSASIGAELTFTVTSSGATGPSYTLYSGEPPALAAAPAGASVDVLGAFTWTPVAGQGGDHTLTVSLVDSALGGFGTPVYETFVVTVNGSPPDTVTIVISEAILVGDIVEVTPPVEIVITESVGVSDEVGVGAGVFIRVTEAIGVADAVVVRSPVLISIVESIGVIDDVIPMASVFITISEFVGVADTIKVTPPVVITITEAVGVGDTIAVIPAALGTISGMKWEDLNGDGTLDIGEPPIEGVTVFLDMNDDALLSPGEPSTLTAIDGSYEFTNLATREWVVREVVPAGYVQTFPAAAVEGEHRVTVTGSDSVSNVDFGNSAVATPAPVIQPIDDVVLDVGEFVEIGFVLEGDPDPALYAHEWTGYPPTALINGVIPYTPLPEQAGTEYKVTLTVTAKDNPAVFDTEIFSILVNELNHPATIAPISDAFGVPGQDIIVELDITDPEGDAYTKVWHGPPPNALINGIFILNPTSDQAGEAFPITLDIVQAGQVVATETFTVFVGEVPGDPDGLPGITPIPGGGIEVTGGGFEPETDVGIFMFSAPALLGTARVSDDGTFGTVVEIPVGTDSGFHTIVVVGTAAGGGTRSLAGPIEISVDPDQDGLTSAEESFTGTDPSMADTDGDGLVDGIDPTWLKIYLSGLPRDAFKSRFAKVLLTHRVAWLEAAVSLGERRIALYLISSIERRTDGCGSSSDRNDWIRDCDTQAEFRELLGLLKRNIGVMEIPEPPLWRGWPRRS